MKATPEAPGLVFSTEELCDLCEVTPRQLHYWATIGLYRPVGGGGYGTPYIWGAEVLPQARLVARLMALGCHGAVVRRVLDWVDREGQWSGTIYVTGAGDVRRTMPASGAAWAVTLTGLDQRQALAA